MKKKTKVPYRSRTVVLNPTGDEDLDEMKNKLCELAKSRSYRIRLALDIASRMSAEDLAKSAGHYMQREYLRSQLKGTAQ